jgi:DNA-binding XRE family transcriptional regulator
MIGLGQALHGMDDQRLGMALRAARLRRGWTQAEVARRAGVSAATVSRVERGFLGRLSLAVLRAVGAVVEVSVRIEARSRAGDVDRLLDGPHAGLVGAVVRVLTACGWEPVPEVSFSVFGERGVVDLVAWHAATRTLLLIEVKTRLVEVGDLLAQLGRRQRLGRSIAGDLGRVPARIASLLVIEDTRTNRRDLARHRDLIAAALPSDGRTVAAVLRDPASAPGFVGGRLFLTSLPAGNVRRDARRVSRARPARSRSSRP